MQCDSQVGFEGMPPKSTFTSTKYALGGCASIRLWFEDIPLGDHDDATFRDGKSCGVLVTVEADANSGGNLHSFVDNAVSQARASTDGDSVEQNRLLDNSQFLDHNVA